MLEFLLQIDTTQVAGSPTTNVPKNLFETVLLGGWIMVPLAILLVVAIFIFFERIIAIRHASRIDGNFMNIIRDHIINGNITAARSFAKNTNSPVARIVDKGIQRIGKPITVIESSMDNVAQLEMYNLERNLNVLSVISRAAPIFGFIGTLAGLMQLFSEIRSSGALDLSVISGGIYTKLVTSITGLLIGLIAFLFYSYLHTQVEKSINKMEYASSDLLDVLQEPTRN